MLPLPLTLISHSDPFVTFAVFEPNCARHRLLWRTATRLRVQGSKTGLPHQLSSTQQSGAGRRLTPKGPPRKSMLKVSAPAERLTAESETRDPVEVQDVC